MKFRKFILTVRCNLNMKHSLFIFFLLTTIACSVSKSDLIAQKIVFKKEFIGHKAIYHIDIPKFDNIESETILFTGGHGHGFQIIYSDSSSIYYSNDKYTTTPNYENYKTDIWNSYRFLESPKDTIIEGVLANGLRWKEIKKGNDFIGYTNVSNLQKSSFEKSILSFKK